MCSWEVLRHRQGLSVELRANARALLQARLHKLVPASPSLPLGLVMAMPLAAMSRRPLFKNLCVTVRAPNDKVLGQ
jgi:hypothetical protein